MYNSLRASHPISSLSARSFNCGCNVLPTCGRSPCNILYVAGPSVALAVVHNSPSVQYQMSTHCPLTVCTLLCSFWAATTSGMSCARCRHDDHVCYVCRQSHRTSFNHHQNYKSYNLWDLAMTPCNLVWMYVLWRNVLLPSSGFT